jgi:hypothetical protein
VKRRAVISSPYPENMVFDGFEVRTTRRKEVVDTILLINSKLSVKKNWTSDGLLHLSSKVLPTRFELISMVPETIILSVELREQYRQR